MIALRLFLSIHVKILINNSYKNHLLCTPNQTIKMATLRQIKLQYNAICNHRVITYVHSQSYRYCRHQNKMMFYKKIKVQNYNPLPHKKNKLNLTFKLHSRLLSRAPQLKNRKKYWNFQWLWDNALNYTQNQEKWQIMRKQKF